VLHVDAFLAGESAGVVDEEGAAAEEAGEGDGPDEKSGRSAGVAVTRFRPFLWRVDWAVTVDVGAVLVNKLVHTLLADLPAVGVNVDCQAASDSEGLVGLDLLATAADDGEGGAPAGQGRQARRRHNRRGDHGGCHLAQTSSACACLPRPDVSLRGSPMVSPMTAAL